MALLKMKNKYLKKNTGVVLTDGNLTGKTRTKHELQQDQAHGFQEYLGNFYQYKRWYRTTDLENNKDFKYQCQLA